MKHTGKRIAAFLLAMLLVVSCFANGLGGLTESVEAAEPNVIYIANAGTGDGTSADNAMGDTSTTSMKDTALYKAWKQLITAGGGTIVICGEYKLVNGNCTQVGSFYDFYLNESDSIGNLNNPNKNVSITYTSVYGGVDYRTTNSAKLVLSGTSQLIFPCNTKTENLTVKALTNTAHYLAAHTCDLELGNGTTFENESYLTVLGALRTSSGYTLKTGDTNITVDLGSDDNKIGAVYGLSLGGNKTHTGNVNITVKSGTVGLLCGDTVSANQVPVNGTVTMNLQGGKYTGYIYGNNSGFDTACTTKTVTMNITGGDFTSCPGIQANTGKITTYKVADSCVADAMTVDSTTAKQLKAICDTSVTLKVPNRTVVYIANAGTGDGTSADNAMGDTSTTTMKETALYKAWKQLIEEGGGTIVICGEYKLVNGNCTQVGSFYDFYLNESDSIGNLNNPNKNVSITYTSVYGGVDYRTTNSAKLVLSGTSQLIFPCNTKTENLTVKALTNTAHYLAAHTCDLELGNGTTFENESYLTVLGALRTSSGYTLKTGDTNITVDLGSDDNKIGAVYGLSLGGNKTHTGNVNITVKSGTVGLLCGDTVSANQVPVNGTVTMNLQGGKYTGYIYGNNSGFDTACTTKTVTMNITGGDFSSCPGIQANTGKITTYKVADSCVADAMTVNSDTVTQLKKICDASVTLKVPAVSNVIYISDNGTGDGSSADKALKPTTGNYTVTGSDTDAKQKDSALYQAINTLIGQGGGTIVICGPYTLNNSNTQLFSNGASYSDFKMDIYGAKHNITITFTSVYDGVDYRQTNNAALILDDKAQMNFQTATVLENITVKAANNRVHYLAADTCDLTLSTGTNFENASYLTVLGGLRTNSGIALRSGTDSSNVVIDIGEGNTIGDVYGLGLGGNKAHIGNANITLKSGTVGSIYGDSVVKGQMYINGDVNINIAGGKVTGYIYGNNVGFSGSCNKKVNINITGGDFTSCKGIQAATSQAQNTAAVADAIVDARSLTIEAARKVKPLCDTSVTLLLPEGYTDEQVEHVIYISDNGTGDGSSADKPLKPTTGNYTVTGNDTDAKQKDTALYQAIETLIGQGGGTIVICGPYTLNNSNTQLFSAGASYSDFKMDIYGAKHNTTITFTSVYDGVDYRETNNAALILDEKAQMNFQTATVLENITVRAANNSAHYLAADTCDLTLSTGTNFENAAYLKVLGGLRTNSGIALRSGTDSSNVVIDIGEGSTIGDVYGIGLGGNKAHVGNANITLKSGTVGSIYGDSVVKGQMYINGDVNINIAGGKVTGYIYGNNVGFSGNCSKKVNINITGGDFESCKGIKAATSQAQNTAAVADAIVDARSLTVEAARKVKPLCDTSVTLLLPEGYTDEQVEHVIYISDNGTGDGSSPDKALKPTTGNYDTSAANPEKQKDTALYQAMEKLLTTGGGTIVICGPYTLNDSNCQPIGTSSADFILPTGEYRSDVTITYTSVYGGVDYRKTNNAELILDERAQLTFPSATVLQDITVRAAGTVEGHYLAAGTNPITLGQGTNFLGSEDAGNTLPTVLGAFRTNGGRLKSGDINITVDIGDENQIGDIYGLCNGGNGTHTGDVTINVKSGKVGAIYGDSRATNQVPICGDITMNLSGGKYLGVISANNIGFADGCDKKAVINITGGDFTDCQLIQRATTSVSTYSAGDLTVDARQASLDTARPVKWITKTGTGVTLLLPEGYYDDTSKNVIFISSDNPGYGDGSGKDANNPLIPTKGNYNTNSSNPERQKDSALYQAMTKLMRLGGGTIVICGQYTLDDSNCQPIGASSADFILDSSLYRYDIAITYTSVYGGVDYRATNNAQLVLAGRSHLTFPTTTYTRNLTIRATGDYAEHYICGGTNPLYLSSGTNFLPNTQKGNTYPTVLGGFRTNGGRLKGGDIYITVDIGNNNRIGDIYGLCNGGSGAHYGSTYITVKSGHVGSIYGDSRIANQVTLRGSVNMNFSGGIFDGYIVGVNAGMTEGISRPVNIKITGGDFSLTDRILAASSTVSGNKASEVIADCTKASVEVARWIDKKADDDVTVLLPEGYTEGEDEGIVVFVCDGATGDGSSAASPLGATTGNYDPDADYPQKYKDASLYQAWQKVMKAGGGTIVICGPYTVDDSNSQIVGASSSDFMMVPDTLYRNDITITYTSVYDGVDYRETNNAELILGGRASLTFPTATVLENITVRPTEEQMEHFLCAGLNDLTLSKGTNFIATKEGKPESCVTILGAFRANASRSKTGDPHITIDIGDENQVGNIYGLCNGGNGNHTGEVYITVKSGQVGNIYGDSRAVGQVGLCGNVHFDLQGGIFKGIIAGVNVGFTGDSDRRVDIKITGGDFSQCVAIMGTSMTATLGTSRECYADLTEADNDLAYQVSQLCYNTVTVLFPDGYEEPVEKEPVEEETETQETEETSETAETPETAESKSGAGAVVAVIVVAVAAAGAGTFFVLKKKKV